MIDDKHNLILILLPKTGSSSLVELDFVRRNIDPKKHFVHRHYDDIQDSHMNYYKVCTCRNPYSKCVSLWSYWNMRFEIAGKSTFKFHNFVLNFDKIVQKVKQTFGKYEEIHFKGCCESVKFSTNGKLSFDDIDDWIRLENFQSDLDVVCDNIGISRQKLKYKLRTKHKHYTEYYNDETKKIIANRYAEDIAYFGYEFGE